MDSYKKESGPSHDPETTLYKQAQGGSRESLNELMDRHEKLVHFVVHRQWLLTVSYEDALQAGRQGLWRAIMGYDPGRGIRFSTYAYRAIMRYIWSSVKGEKRRQRREIAMGVLVSYFYRTEPDVVWVKEREEVTESVGALVAPEYW